MSSLRPSPLFPMGLRVAGLTGIMIDDGIPTDGSSEHVKQSEDWSRVTADLALGNYGLGLPEEEKIAALLKIEQATEVQQIEVALHCRRLVENPALDTKDLRRILKEIGVAIVDHRAPVAGYK